MLTITLTDNCFNTDSADGDQCAVLWADVRAIVAFKRDLFGVDVICLEFRVGESECWLEIDEECTGYNELVTEIERRFEIERDWWSKVAFPAFDTNRMTLWEDPSLSDR